MGIRLQGENKPIRWPDLTPEERHEFTMEHDIQQTNWFIDGTVSGGETFYDKDEVQKLVEQAKRKEPNYYEMTDPHVYNCFDRNDISGKSVAVLGSVQPWYEAVIIAYGGKPTTIEYNKIKTNDDRLTLMTVDEYNENPQKFDIAVSISSFEHDGLGRYGDPIDPEGDFKAMKNVRENILDVGGILFLGVPMGVDRLVWNAHRIYGKKRWPKLIEGFEIIDESGFKDGNVLDVDTGSGCTQQPIVVLKNKG